MSTAPSSSSPQSRDGKNSRPSARPTLGESTLSVHAGEARQKPGDSITDPIFLADLTALIIAAGPIATHLLFEVTETSTISNLQNCSDFINICFSFKI